MVPYWVNDAWDRGTYSLKGEYFHYSKEDKELKTCFSGQAVITRIDRIIHFRPWNYGADHYPALPIGVNQDYFAVRWTGKLFAPISGNYKFQTYSDNGVRVWVEDMRKPLIDFWGDEVYGREETSRAIKLIAGKGYPIKVEYFQAYGDKYVTLRWGSLRATIPTK